jgi:hypothetical protein
MAVSKLGVTLVLEHYTYDLFKVYFDTYINASIDELYNEVIEVDLFPEQNDINSDAGEKIDGFLKYRSVSKASSDQIGVYVGLFESFTDARLFEKDLQSVVPSYECIFFKIIPMKNRKSGKGMKEVYLLVLQYSTVGE